MSIKLKIKAKSLAEEAKIIRKEERKLKGQISWLKIQQEFANSRKDREDKLYSDYFDLHQHRTWDVRNEARATHLARGYLAGRKYSELEFQSDLSFVNWYISPKAVTMIKKYGDPDFTRDQFKEWTEKT